MADMEKKLQADEDAAGREINITSVLLNDTNSERHSQIDAKPARKPGPKNMVGKKLTRQTLGTCQTCGYMSSQAVCKACTLLEGLNKNRPKIEIEIDVDDEESSTLRRRMEGIALVGE